MTLHDWTALCQLIHRLATRGRWSPAEIEAIGYGQVQDLAPELARRTGVALAVIRDRAPQVRQAIQWYGRDVHFRGLGDAAREFAPLPLGYGAYRWGGAA